MTEKYGWDFFEKLNKLNPLIGRSIDDAVAMLNSGERQVAICSAASAFRSAATGNPLAVNYATSFSLADYSPSAILKGSRSPNAAKLFMNFLTGTEFSADPGQEFRATAAPRRAAAARRQIAGGVDPFPADPRAYRGGTAGPQEQVARHVRRLIGTRAARTLS